MKYLCRPDLLTLFTGVLLDQRIIKPYRHFPVPLPRLPSPMTWLSKCTYTDIYESCYLFYCLAWISGHKSYLGPGMYTPTYVSAWILRLYALISRHTGWKKQGEIPSPFLPIIMFLNSLPITWYITIWYSLETRLYRRFVAYAFPPSK